MVRPKCVLILKGAFALASPNAGIDKEFAVLDIIISIFTDPGFAKGFFAGAIQQIQEIVGPWS